jgi:hypothetical protein
LASFTAKCQARGRTSMARCHVNRRAIGQARPDAGPPEPGKSRPSDPSQKGPRRRTQPLDGWRFLGGVYLWQNCHIGKEMLSYQLQNRVCIIFTLAGAGAARRNGS